MEERLIFARRKRIKRCDYRKAIPGMIVVLVLFGILLHKPTEVIKFYRTQHTHAHTHTQILPNEDK